MSIVPDVIRHLTSFLLRDTIPLFPLRPIPPRSLV